LEVVVLEKIKQIIAEQERAPLPDAVKAISTRKGGGLLKMLMRFIQARARSGEGESNAIEGIGKYKGRR
jgi:hypothetical protein